MKVQTPIQQRQIRPISERLWRKSGVVLVVALVVVDQTRWKAV